jgi:hypothetical protein
LIRKLSLNSVDSVIASETLAGKLTSAEKPETQNGKASDAELARNSLMDFAVDGNGSIIFTDPWWGVIRIAKP